MTVKRFITAFIICILILIAALAMIRADLSTRRLSGDYERSIFSYEKTAYNQGRLELFGVVYSVDLDFIAVIQEKSREIYKCNLNFIPDFILNSYDIFKDAITNLFDNFV